MRPGCGEGSEAFAGTAGERLELLQDLGAELLPFSPLRDRKLPEGAQGLLLGGGSSGASSGTRWRKLADPGRGNPAGRWAPSLCLPWLSAGSYLGLQEAPERGSGGATCTPWQAFCLGRGLVRREAPPVWLHLTLKAPAGGLPAAPWDGEASDRPLEFLHFDTRGSG
ncbi:MAG: hypothetical protein ACLU9S_11815 [Oscillospiraceae bacterium]